MKFRYPREKALLLAHLDTLKPGLAQQHIVTVKSFKPGTNEQLAYFFKAVIEPVCDEVGETRQWGEDYLYRRILIPACAPYADAAIGSVKVQKTLSEMDKNERTQFIERCQAFISTELIEGFRWG